MKVVINTCYGGFSLSEKGKELYQSLSGKSDVYDWDIDRDDPLLVQVVESLGSAADGFCAELKVVEIPEGINWGIAEYDGREHLAQTHQTWN